MATTSTITVRFLVPAGTAQPHGHQHFHFADFAPDAAVEDLYRHAQQRIVGVPPVARGDRLRLLVEAYADGPLVTLRRDTPGPLVRLPFCAGGLCAVEVHMPAAAAAAAADASPGTPAGRARGSRAASPSGRGRAAHHVGGVAFVPSAPEAARAYVQRFSPPVPEAVGPPDDGGGGPDLQQAHAMSASPAWRTRSGGGTDGDDGGGCRGGHSREHGCDEALPAHVVPVASTRLTATERHAQDITVSRSLNAALGREIDSLGEKMAYYVSALAAMEDRREALKRELASVERAARTSKADSAACEQNCDRLHQARHRLRQQLSRSQQSLAVTSKKLQTETRKFKKFHEGVEQVREARSASEARLAVKRQKLEALARRNADMRQELLALRAENETYVAGARSQQKVVNQLEGRMRKFMASNAHLLGRVKEIEGIAVPGVRHGGGGGGGGGGVVVVKATATAAAGGGSGRGGANARRRHSGEAGGGSWGR